MILNHDTNICSAATKTTITSRNTCYVNSHLDMESSICGNKKRLVFSVGWVEDPAVAPVVHPPV